ncbi:MAG: ATP-binding cassette domain-containing protein [Desulfobacteraceae bacterium]
MSFLRIEDLHINLGEFYLKNIFLTMEKGDYLMIIGPTGAGKTILLESIIGFSSPDRGKIYLEDRDITNELPEKRHIGIVYQDYALLPHFTVYKNIAYGLKKIEKPGCIKEKVNDMAQSLHIDHLLHRKPETLSGGEQQRVALARSLVVEPRLLLMDEPFSALDPQTRRQTRKLLKQAVKKKKTTVVHISHDLDDAWSLASKVAVFREGRLLQFGDLDEVFNRPGSRFIADFVDVTVLKGIAVENGKDVSTIAFDGFKLQRIDEAEPGTEVKVALRPENIILSRRHPEEMSVQNVLKSELEEIVNEGKTSMIFLKYKNTKFRVLVTNNAVDQLRLKPGDTLYALIKSANVRII